MTAYERHYLAAARVGLGAIAALTVLRALRAPGSYALGHWLLSYQHGLVKRGLVGTIVGPLLTWKAPEEVRFALETLSAGVILTLIVAFAWTCTPLITTGPRPTRVAQTAGAAAFACSGWFVFVGHTNGYFDHLLEVALLVAVALVGTRLRALVPVIAIAAIATHEAFLVYGLPVLVFATLVAAAPGTRPVARDLTVLLMPIAVAGALFAGFAGLTPAPDVVDALRHDVDGLLGPLGADNAVFHLTQDVLADSKTAKDVVERVTRVDLLRAAGPNALLAWGWTVACLWSTPRRPLVLLVPIVTLAPLALHAVASDTPRFTLMVVFQSFAVWAAVQARCPPPPLSPRAAALAAAFAGAVVLNNVLGEVPLMQDHRDGDGALAPRSAPSSRSFQDCAPVFASADFEHPTLAPWAGDEGFVLRPAVSPRGRRLASGTSGRQFLRSGRTHRGTLVSPPFQLRGDVMLAAIAGSRDRKRIRVSLRVDGAEVAWATGSGGDAFVTHVWDVAAWRGRAATIAIVDETSGYLTVDGFCVFQGLADR